MAQNFREIKYKVWNPDTKQMSDGMPIPMLAGYLTAIYPNLKNEIYVEYTGHKDKNGKEIYEGDILYIVRKKEKKNGRKNGYRWKIVKWDNKKNGFGAISNNWTILTNFYENPKYNK